MNHLLSETIKNNLTDALVYTAGDTMLINGNPDGDDVLVTNPDGTVETVALAGMSKYYDQLNRAGVYHVSQETDQGTLHSSVVVIPHGFGIKCGKSRSFRRGHEKIRDSIKHRRQRTWDVPFWGAYAYHMPGMVCLFKETLMQFEILKPYFLILIPLLVGVVLVLLKRSPVKQYRKLRKVSFYGA